MSATTLTLLLVATAGFCAADEPLSSRQLIERVAAQQAENARKVVEASVESQQGAVRQTMEASVTKQRDSVARQPGGAPGTSFLPFFPVTMATPGSATLASPDCEAIEDAQLDPLISEAARREGLQARLLRLVIDQESRFYPCAVSRKGAMGLMQLMPDTARLFGVDDPFDPQQNIGAGAKFLKQLLVRYGGDLALALGAYNAGPARVDAAGGVPLLSETVGYVNEIMRRIGEKEESRQAEEAPSLGQGPPADSSPAQ